MKPNKTVKIGDGHETGVWVLKLKSKTLEMEFDLDPEGNEYLFYQVFLFFKKVRSRNRSLLSLGKIRP